MVLEKLDVKILMGSFMWLFLYEDVVDD